MNFIIIFSLILAVIVLSRTIWALNRYRYRPVETNPSDLPSVSVCIPARDETHALARCLERVLKSDYSKLEILVLDDGSKDDTSLIIKSFAHAGVRFIPGRELPPGWLGKNHAYQTLMLEASSEYLLFMDVDSGIEPDTIRLLVAQLVSQNKSMLSVLPRREDGQRASVIFGTLRHFWELALASSQRPPSASTFWMIKRHELINIEKGLSSYGSSLRPESHIAHHLQKTKDYYYLIGTRSLGVWFEKRWVSQLDTAMRLYVPIFGRTYTATVMSFIAMLILIIPILMVVSGTLDNSVSVFLAATQYIILLIAIGLYTQKTTDPLGWQIRTLLWPIIVLQDALLLAVSIYRYGTKTVMWKGRPVTMPTHSPDHLHIDE